MDAMTSGGKGGLSTTDVAASLGMGHLSDQCMCTGMAYYTQEPHVLVKLRTKMVWRCVDYFTKGDWSTDRDLAGLIVRVGNLSVIEFVLDGWCSACSGSGRNTNRGQQCGACKGSGKRPMSDTYKALRVNKSKSQWSRVWGARYAMVLNELYQNKEKFDNALKKH